jgi:fermentation-respiration switch protein FrsA (DUF1100 family)
VRVFLKNYSPWLFILATFYTAHAADMGCLSRLRREEIQSRLEFLSTRPQAPKIRSTRVYYPKDFVEGDERDVLVYMHGFGSNVDSYERKVSERPSLQETISSFYEEKRAREPVVLSFSMGATVIAGVREHGADHKFFLPVEDFWMALEESLADLPLRRRNLFFYANSGGAWSAFQMLKHPPDNILVDAAVFHALPQVTPQGLAPNPALQVGGENLDETGTLLRAQVEPLLNSFMADRHFESLLPSSALQDNSLPRQVPILLQGGAWDPFGYTALNEDFSLAAQRSGYPIYMQTVPGGHANGVDNRLTVEFFLGRRF